MIREQFKKESLPLPSCCSIKVMELDSSNSIYTLGDIIILFSLDEINNIQLIDISGRIFQFEIENQLSTSHINAGFYILNVEYKNGKVLRKKMIKY